MWRTYNNNIGMEKKKKKYCAICMLHFMPNSSGFYGREKYI